MHYQTHGLGCARCGPRVGVYRLGVAKVTQLESDKVEYLVARIPEFPTTDRG